MPQAFGGIVLGQFGQVQAGGEMIADTMDHHRADAIGQMSEAILDRQHDAVIQRIALGRAVEADRHHRACCFDPEQRGETRGCGCGVSHGVYYCLLQNSYTL
jgi:hypothetical protein